VKIYRHRQSSAIAWPVVIVASLLVMPAHSALAQTQEPAKQTPEVQQLKERQ